MKEILKNKEFTNAIFELKNLLERYNILPEDWALSIHISFVAFGYKLDYKRKNHLHIVVDRKKIPWHLTDKDKRFFEFTPPLKSKFAKEYYRYIKNTNFDFDIIAFETPVCRNFFKNCVYFNVKDGTTIQIMSPLSNIKMEAKFWKFYLHHAPEKLERIIGYYQQILKQAIFKKDTLVSSAIKKLIIRYKKPLIEKLNQRESNINKEGIICGQAGNRGKVKGRVSIIKDIDNPDRHYVGDIIVARMTSPKLTPLLMKAKGLVTDEGGSLCHAVIISRELKIACVVGTKNATKILKDGDLVEIDGKNGIIKKIN